MSRSVERTDLFGNRYVQHYDDAGRKIGHSVPYRDHTRHYDKMGKETGRTVAASGVLGGEYEQHYDNIGREDGVSVEKSALLGGDYTQHYDKHGDEAGHSHEHDGVIEHTGEEAHAPRPLIRPVAPPPPPPPPPPPRQRERLWRPPPTSVDTSDFGRFFWGMMALCVALIAAIVLAIWRYRYVRALFFLYVALVIQFGAFASLAVSTHFVIAAFVAAALSAPLYRFCFSALRWRASEGARVNAWLASGIMAAVTLVAYLVIGLTQPAFIANPLGAVQRTLRSGQQQIVVQQAPTAEGAPAETTPASQTPEQIDAATPPDQAATDQAADDLLYDAARAADTIEAYTSYLRTYPTGHHAEEARTASEALVKPVYAPYDVAQLSPQVRAAVLRARDAESRANIAAHLARQAAQQAEIAAQRARNGEPGTRAATLNGGSPRRTVRNETEWRDGSINGFGVQTVIAGASLLGDRYAGEWKDGHLNGVGVLTLERNEANTGNQLRYEGQFQNDAQNGVGQVFWRSGERYAGEMRNGLVGGGGAVLYFSNGNRHEGEYGGGASNGFGVLWDAQGHVLQHGIWRNGNFSTPIAQ